MSSSVYICLAALIRAVGSHPQIVWHQTSQNTRSIPSVFCFINLEVARHLIWILKMKAPNPEVSWPEEQGEDICHRVYSWHLPASLGGPQVGVEGSSWQFVYSQLEVCYGQLIRCRCL